MPTTSACTSLLFTAFFSILAAPLVGATCIWTDTHCACSKRTALLGKSQCYDLVSDIPNSKNKRCRLRDCHESYVCDCNGTSYCEHESEEKPVLYQLNGNECELVSKNVTTVSLVDEDISRVHQTAPTKTRNCVFSDSECTCASSLEIGVTHDCLDYAYEDPEKGPVCRARDCAVAMVCDCGGESHCRRERKTTVAWRKVMNEGRPGLVVCEEFESKTDRVTKVKE